MLEPHKVKVRPLMTIMVSWANKLPEPRLFTASSWAFICLFSFFNPKETRKVACDQSGQQPCLTLSLCSSSNQDNRLAPSSPSLSETSLHPLWLMVLSAALTALILILLLDIRPRFPLCYVMQLQTKSPVDQTTHANRLTVIHSELADRERE